MPTAAYRIVTPRLELRAYDPSQAEALAEAVQASLDRLRPWMPWARAPQPLDATIDLLRRFRSRFDLDTDYGYAVFAREPSRLVGGTGLHARVGPGGLEIGYWIRTGHERRGYATETAGALTRVAFLVHGADRVEIHCDPGNEASARVAARLGFRHEATLRARFPFEGEPPRDTAIWTMFRAAYAGSHAERVSVEAFDVVGRPIALGPS